MKLSKRILALSASQSLQMAARCQQLREQGVDVISMSLGEPDFATPDWVKQAAKSAVDADYSHYGPVPGLPSLREAIVRPLREKGYHADDVVVSVGAKQAICHVVMSLVDAGDEVVIPTPCWVSYSEMVKLSEGKVVEVATRFEDQYKLTPEQLRSAITDRTKLLILCSPNNPTGSIYSRQELQALVDVLKDYPQVYVVADEIYDQIRYVEDYTSLTDFPELRERVVYINGVSKAYAMTGYRIGWLVSQDKDLVGACRKLQSQQITCATLVAQKAAEAALTGPQDSVDEMRQAFALRRELICGLLQEIPHLRYHVPEGAFYVFVDVSGYDMTGDEMSEYLLMEAHVAVVSGSAYGDNRCIRLGFAMSEPQIREALTRMRDALKKKK